LQIEVRRSGRRGGLGKAQAHRRPAAWYRINPQWEVHAYVEYEKLLGDAADSPLVKLRGSSNQTTIGLGASYSFDFRIR
jgi:outer membrane scaffolding protein for murein synthesis (MipA/OmpV family)